MSFFMGPQGNMIKGPNVSASPQGTGDVGNKGYKRVGNYNEISTQNPIQQQLMQLFGGALAGGAGGDALAYLRNLLSGSPESTAAFEAPYRRQFEQQTVPGLAERFAGLGSGAQNSSAFQNALGQAGAGLQGNLASLRSSLQGGAANQLLQGLLSLLNIDTKAFLPREMSFLKQAGVGLSSGIGQGIGESIPLLFGA